MFGNKRLREAVERLGEKVETLEHGITRAYLGRCDCLPADYTPTYGPKPFVYSHSHRTSYVACDRCGREYTLALTPVERRKKERGK